MDVSLEKLKKILKKFSGKKLIVIGDLMLDHYIFGDVERISPEAPVQVVHVDNEKYCPGGAANVSMNIKSLLATPIVVGTIGKDISGDKLKNIFLENNISTDGIFIDNDKPTIKKTRVIARNQHLLRIDFEKIKYEHDKIQEKILDFLTQNINDTDAIILQDYNKGLLSKNLIKKIILIANKNNVIIAADPKKKNFLNIKMLLFSNQISRK